VSDDTLPLFQQGNPSKSGGGPDRMASSVSSPHPDAPLAERMRPRTLDEIVGQADLVGPEGLLRRLQEGAHFPSLILHGPPGSGKTTLGRLLAITTGAEFVPFNAVSEGVPRLREIVKGAREWRKAGRRTLLFVDEIHRLNKGQQDFLLPFVESGLVTLVGATTEHPAFEVNAALLSRTRVLLLRPMEEAELRVVVRRALADSERGLGTLDLTVTPEAEDLIVEASAGDARKALNAIEVGSELVGAGGTIDLEAARQALQQRISLYDTSTAFQMLSAFHKSLRASQGDAALYWAMRMIRGGEDPLVLFRRLIAAAYEDVGLADPRAGLVATQAMQAFERLGPPEGFLPLANAVLYVASAPKSNRAYLALAAARDAAERTPDAPVPLHLRNASTALMREWGFGEGYEYAHNHEGAYVELECLPDELDDGPFYRPTDRGHEASIQKLMRERGQLE
jgi:putative ATPase